VRKYRRRLRTAFTTLRKNFRDWPDGELMYDLQFLKTLENAANAQNHLLTLRGERVHPDPVLP